MNIPIKRPAFEHGITHLDTPDCTEPWSNFADDSKALNFLATNFIVRETHRNEFDPFHWGGKVEAFPTDPILRDMPHEAHLHIPRRWVAVARVSPEAHLITLLFHSEPRQPKWPLVHIGKNVVVNLTGERLVEAIKRMQITHGWEPEAMKRFQKVSC